MNTVSRNGFSVSRMSLHFSNTGSSRLASSSCIFISCFLILSIRVSTRDKSERINSVSNESISRRALMELSGCGTVSFANKRTTCTSASLVFTFERKLVENCVDPDSPFFNPTTSTNSMVACTVLLGVKISEHLSNRVSGIFTIAWWASALARAEGSMCVFVIV